MKQAVMVVLCALAAPATMAQDASPQTFVLAPDTHFPCKPALAPAPLSQLSPDDRVSCVVEAPVAGAAADAAKQPLPPGSELIGRFDGNQVQWLGWQTPSGAQVQLVEQDQGALVSGPNYDATEHLTVDVKKQIDVDVPSDVSLAKTKR